MNHVEVSRQLLDWNTRNLISTANLKKSEIANYFAGSFLVVANGKSYDADHDNYFEFLNGFRSTIRKISYELGDFVVDKMSVAIPLKAHIIRVDGSFENFEAILILRFDKHNKITLWHEVYLKI